MQREKMNIAMRPNVRWENT